MFRSRPLQILLLLTCGVTAVPAKAQQHPGFAPYTPSRIQWLELQANVTYQHQPTSDEPYTLSIIASDPETLTIRVRYNPVLDQGGAGDRGMLLQGTRNGMMMAVTVAKSGIQEIAKASGWNWLKVREDVKNYKQAEDNP